MADTNFVNETIHGAEFIKGFIEGRDYHLINNSTDRKHSFKELIIPNKLKLGEILLKLPYGIVDKQITGIGATTLELKANRNSIIVEPTKSIAYSKSCLNKDYFYAGSPVIKKQKKLSITSISEYVNNSNIEYKKILVVADSLPKVIEAIGSSVFANYFFMIDEVDSFQADSSYRNKLELCLDIYKKFPDVQRCLVTATMLEFSDPTLYTEKFIQIKYDKPVIRKITLINTNTIKSVVANKISEILNADSSAKVVIAYNVIGELAGIVDIITARFSFSPDEIKIICSNSNKKKAGQFFSSILDEKLPAKINFLTSAYFIGVDISENYHCISVSNGSIPYTLLSDHKLKQIAGRCRTKLLSETVIFNCFNRRASKLENLDQNKLISLAERQCSAMKCFELQYQKEEALINEILQLKKAIIDQQNANGINLIRTDINSESKISYFSIDGILENTRVKHTLYLDPTQLYQTLSSQGHKVEIYDQDLDLGVEKTHNFKDDDKETIEEALTILTNYESPSFNGLYKIKQECESPIQEEIYSQFIELSPLIGKEETIIKITEFAGNDRRNYKKYRMAVFFEARSDNNPLKKDILENFQVGNLYTSEEIRDKLSTILKRNFTDLFLPNLQNSEDAVTQLKTFFKTKIKRDRKSGKRWQEIVGTNPFNIVILSNNPKSIDNRWESASRVIDSNERMHAKDENQ